MCIAHFVRIKSMNYGYLFKKARKESGLTQKQVAEKMAIHQSNISDWENDISRPEYEKLIQLSILYEVSVYDLLGVPEKYRF